MATAANRISGQDDGGRPPVIAPGHTFGSVTDKISAIVLTRQHAAAAGGSASLSPSALVMLLLVAIAYLFVEGVGIWGINIPVGWGFAIVNFVWWIGIGHAGHADLGDPAAAAPEVAHVDQPLRRGDDALRRRLRRDVPAAAPGPALVLLLAVPYPNTMELWPQFRSPLVWDVFAVSTYFTVSLLFWYVGLIPDLATLRDRATSTRRRRSSTACWRWAGAARRGTGSATRSAYLLLAGLATPLVVSVHTRRQLRLRGRASCPAGTRRSSRRTSSPARSSPASRWC